MDIYAEKLDVKARGDVGLTLMGVKEVVVYSISRDEEEVDSDYERTILIVTRDGVVTLDLFAYEKENLVTHRSITEERLEELKQERERGSQPFWLQPKK